jgi:hypothetical protein
MRRWLVFACVCALLATGCSSSSATVPASPSYGTGIAAIDRSPCEGRESVTLTQLEACIQRATLWRRLSVFQRIADENPGRNGHGNRDTGTPGYKASVEYVAGLVRRAGYRVRVQPYNYKTEEIDGTPVLRTPSRTYAFERDWFVARGSSGGAVTATVVAARGSGCSPGDFVGFARGSIALMERSACALDAQIANARAAGAVAAILYDEAPGFEAARLNDPPGMPVAGVATNAAAELLRAPRVQLDIRMRAKSGIDYNLIAESPLGNPNSVVVVEGHLDSIYGAGMLDNASGSTTILEIALNLAKTPTQNRLRYIWFGGEELGLLGSHYYTQHLSHADLHRIVFDVDADVTATPNFDILIADPRRAFDVKRFPPNVVPESKIGNALFADFFHTGGVIFRAATFGNDGTDSNAFSLVGVPNTGILTNQDCCKRPWEKQLWGGFLGNYEGDIPSFNGGCVDKPRRWCDNLSNNDQFVLELASKAVAYVAFNLANHPFP